MNNEPIQDLAKVGIIMYNRNRALMHANRCRVGGRAYKNYVKQAEVLRKMALEVVEKAKGFIENSVDNTYNPW